MMEVPKNYNPKESEPKWQKFWGKNKLFVFNPKSKKPVYSIDTPPPYVSASHLHIGHAMSYSQAEFVARYKRMKGYEIFYPMGFDDNGLPTERFVEKKHKINKSKISRSDFIKLCLEETKKGGETYRKLWTALGISVDWSLLYSTIDSRCQRIAQRSFIDLYKKKRLKRKEEPVIWCPHCRAAFAQADLEDMEQDSSLNDINFETENGVFLTISTTRPELIPACVALCCHPDDERYKKLLNKKIKVPMMEHSVSIITDESVKMDFGTGLMMVCTWGDVEDIEKWKVRKLDTRMIIEKNGRLNKLAGKYEGLKLNEARKQILEDLKDKGLLVAQKKIKNVLNVHERCKTPTEFYLIPQWNILLLDKKEELIKMAEKVNWYPHFMKARYDDWVKGLKWDWNISRERYYGVPFPVWYCKKCSEVMLPEDKELPVDPTEKKPSKTCKCGSKDFIPEKDVMDTWMTSSVTPLINSLWGEKNDLMKQIYPMSLRPQAHDIIRTWAFYTIVKSYYHHKKIPWTDIMISGHGQDAKGRKMSKSLGNVVSPEDVIEKYCADALRFWSASVTLGHDLPFMEKELVTGKKTVTKLWNASKFVFMHLKDFDGKKPAKLELIDQWVLSKLQGIIKASTDGFEEYEYSKAKNLTDNFFWNVFCDYYLEIVKDRIYNPDKRGEASRKSAQYTLYQVLLAVIKLFAPIMPHITEELYQLYFKGKEKDVSIHVSSWPLFEKKLVSSKAEEVGDLMVYVIGHARKVKSEQNKSLKEPIKELTLQGKITSKDFEAIKEDLKACTTASKINYKALSKDSKADMSCDIIL